MNGSQHTSINLSNDYSLVITGTWQTAESAWMRIKMSGSGLTSDQARDWVKFQMEVLDKTKKDPLKEELRILAIQEMGYYPEVSVNYINELRQCLATNYFTEASVRQKAVEVVAKLEAVQSK